MGASCGETVNEAARETTTRLTLANKQSVRWPDGSQATAEGGPKLPFGTPSVGSWCNGSHSRLKICRPTAYGFESRAPYGGTPPPPKSPPRPNVTSETATS